ncbi:hypothetical protein AMK68_04370 [candidate division KD3-62 bacterium DG_56]|uniref:Uncharacterized protein n=1 Tax=candidate division KD3-62 bacterium DG_56 TaxID=1704032 RepID=A0A0S7XKB9_9BACT|nr:MAG: hypothetical protein AMK68_04370 [candidate division KD3-62 bacterium DG_56]
MGDKEKKQLMFAIPLLAVAAFMVYWFIIKPQTKPPPPPETPRPTTETAVTQPTPGGTGATGAPEAADMAMQVALASGEHGSSREPGRSDPFVPYINYRKIEPGGPGDWTAIMRPEPKLPPVEVGYLVTPFEGWEGVEEEHERRMAGMLHNGRVWAIYEKDGISQIVKPGDPVGDETVIAIGTDHLILRSLDGRERQVPLERISGYEATGRGYGPPGYAPAPGPGRPPGPPVL